MLARSLAWQFLKQFGLERPRVVVVRTKHTTAKIDIQKYKRSSREKPKIPRRYNSVSHRKPTLA